MNAQELLIVDDNEMNVKLLRVLLLNEGFKVRFALDAEQAQDLLKNWRPDLILMDIQLPGMNGLDLTRLLKADPEMHDIRVVALTAYAMKGDQQKALEAGCDGYISKPINTRTFLDVILHHLGQRQPEELDMHV